MNKCGKKELCVKLVIYKEYKVVKKQTLILNATVGDPQYYLEVYNANILTVVLLYYKRRKNYIFEKYICMYLHILI